MFTLAGSRSSAAAVPRPPHPISAMRIGLGAPLRIDGAWGRGMAAVAAAVVSTNSRRVTSRGCVGVMTASQLVGLFRQLVRQGPRHAAGVAQVEHVPPHTPPH